MSKPAYQRIMLKVSGEAFADEDGEGIDVQRVQQLVADIGKVQKMGVEVAIVLGGGNFWRFRDFQKMDIPRVASDQIGMLATVMNVLILANMLNQTGIPAHPYSAFAVDSIVSRYKVFAAKKELVEKKVVVLGGGTGSPYFTTDTAAALRASELDCDVLLKATKVNGVYDSDPEKNPKAKRYTELTFSEAMEKELKVMDQNAFCLCAENNIPIVVFDGFQKGSLAKILQGEKIGTMVRR